MLSACVLWVCATQLIKGTCMTVPFTLRFYSCDCTHHWLPAWVTFRISKQTFDKWPKQNIFLRTLWKKKKICILRFWTIVLNMSNWITSWSFVDNMIQAKPKLCWSLWFLCLNDLSFFKLVYMLWNSEKGWSRFGWKTILGVYIVQWTLNSANDWL